MSNSNTTTSYRDEAARERVFHENFIIRGGRTGTKFHTGSAGSSTTGCGIWLRHNVSYYKVTGVDVNCEKCLGDRTEPITDETMAEWNRIEQAEVDAHNAVVAAGGPNHEAWSAAKDAREAAKAAEEAPAETGTVEVAKTVTVTDEVTPEVAAAELARRAANRAAKRTGAPRTEPTSKAAFKMSKAQLEGMVA